MGSMPKTHELLRDGFVPDVIPDQQPSFGNKLRDSLLMAGDLWGCRIQRSGHGDNDFYITHPALNSENCARPGLTLSHSNTNDTQRSLVSYIRKVERVLRDMNVPRQTTPKTSTTGVLRGGLSPVAVVNDQVEEPIVEADVPDEEQVVEPVPVAARTWEIFRDQMQEEIEFILREGELDWYQSTEFQEGVLAGSPVVFADCGHPSKQDAESKAAVLRWVELAIDERDKEIAMLRGQVETLAESLSNMRRKQPEATPIRDETQQPEFPTDAFAQEDRYKEQDAASDEERAFWRAFRAFRTEIAFVWNGTANSKTKMINALRIAAAKSEFDPALTQALTDWDAEGLSDWLSHAVAADGRRLAGNRVVQCVQKACWARRRKNKGK